MSLYVVSEHEYKASAPGIENDRTMIFFNEARVDGLVKRVETPLSMTEYFIDRPDFLHYRHVEFGRREKKFGPAESAIPRPIEVCTSNCIINVCSVLMLVSLQWNLFYLDSFLHGLFLQVNMCSR